MTDFFGNGYFGEYFADGYFGPTAETNPGSMSASLSGSGDASAVLTSSAATQSNGGFIRFTNRHDLVYRPIRLRARKALRRLEDGEDIAAAAQELAVLVAERIRERPQDKGLSATRNMAMASLSLASLDASRTELKASLLKIEAAAEEFAEMVEEDDAIVAILLAA